MLDIQNSLGNVEIIVPGRSFVREGNFEKVNNKGKSQTRHFFLFSDELMYCKVSLINTKQQFKGRIPIDKCKTAISESKEKSRRKDVCYNFLFFF